MQMPADVSPWRVIALLAVLAGLLLPARDASAQESAPAGSSAGPMAGRAAFGPAWPGPSNTGVPKGTALTVVDGNLHIKEPGTVIEGKFIRGCVRVTAPGVVIRRTKVRCAFGYAVESNGYTGERLLIEDSEIDCIGTDGRPSRATAVGDNNINARRLNIHGCENGFDVDNDVTIQDTWIHDLNEHDREAHTDGIQIAVGQNVLIENNAIFVKGGTSAIITHPRTMDGVVIRGNLLAGGAYTLYCPRERSRNVRVIGNRFSRDLNPKGGAYGPWTDCEKVAELVGNVWDETGQPLPGQRKP